VRSMSEPGEIICMPGPYGRTANQTRTCEGTTLDVEPEEAAQARTPRTQATVGVPITEHR
jgi:hypothetical protein